MCVWVCVCVWFIISCVCQTAYIVLSSHQGTDTHTKAQRSRRIATTIGIAHIICLFETAVQASGKSSSSSISLVDTVSPPNNTTVIVMPVQTNSTHRSRPEATSDTIPSYKHLCTCLVAHTHTHQSTACHVYMRRVGVCSIFFFAFPKTHRASLFSFGPSGLERSCGLRIFQWENTQFRVPPFWYIFSI